MVLRCRVQARYISSRHAESNPEQPLAGLDIDGVRFEAVLHSHTRLTFAGSVDVDKYLSQAVRRVLSCVAKYCDGVSPHDARLEPSTTVSPDCTHLEDMDGQRIEEFVSQSHGEGVLLDGYVFYAREPFHLHFLLFGAHIAASLGLIARAGGISSFLGRDHLDTGFLQDGVQSGGLGRHHAN